MSKLAHSSTLITFLESLDADSDIGVTSSSYLKVVMDDGDNELMIRGDDVSKVLASEDTIREFFTAIGSPDDAGVELYSIDAPAQKTAPLETYFDYVEEV